MSAPCVVGMVATHRRPAELKRLVRSLRTIPDGLGGLVVVDNAGQPEVAGIVRDFGETGHSVVPGKNLGCGGGLRLAGQEAFKRFGDRLTHLWVLDDDAVVHPDALAILVEAMHQTRAGAAYPMVLTQDQRVGWSPGVLERRRRRFLESGITPQAYIARYGDAPVPFTWAPGVALLATRAAVEAIGLHRDDFWVRGEDLDFSLRLTAHAGGVFVPRAIVSHLPPEPPAAAASRLDAEYLKHCAMLQNIFYLTLRLPHGRCLWPNLPGVLRRFFGAWQSAHAVQDALLAFWLGAVKGLPAGRAGADTFMHRCLGCT